jgi:predicted secreted protein
MNTRTALSKTPNRMLLALGLALGGHAAAQAQAFPEPRNVVQLASSGTVEAQQDWLTLTLSVTKEGRDAAEVQNYLRQAAETALTQVKKSVQAGEMEVRTGAFSLNPRYGNDGKMSGWAGRTELVLEGSDFGRISSAAVKAQPMTIQGLNFSLSRAERTRLEDQARTLAIASFKTKASSIAKEFGFSDYVLREVQVHAADQNPEPRPHMMAMAPRAMAADAPPVPLESGKSLVVVSVSGAIQLK